MTDLLVLELVDKRLVTDQMVLTIGYDIDNLRDQKIKYGGSVTTDRYGRKVPKHAMALLICRRRLLQPGRSWRL